MENPGTASILYNVHYTHRHTLITNLKAQMIDRRRGGKKGHDHVTYDRIGLDTDDSQERNSKTTNSDIFFILDWTRQIATPDN